MDAGNLDIGMRKKRNLVEDLAEVKKM